MESKIYRLRLFVVLTIAALLQFPSASLHADNNPLCFTARNGSVTVTFDIKNVTPSSIQYSKNLTLWNTCSATTNVTLNAGESVYFRAATNKTASTAVAFGAVDIAYSSHFTFSSTNGGTIEASGNIMSLYGPSCPIINLPISAFAKLFCGCTSLTTAPTLPATTMAETSYANMFEGCTSLTTAPALPATNLARFCYSSMFEGCTSLINAPVSLPATTLIEYCYFNMFKGCTSLLTPPALPATILANGCYIQMFEDCTSLLTAPSLPATTLFESCYNSMFHNCTSLTTPPVLPATNLANNCYMQMFYGCTSLTAIPALPATTLTENCYLNMCLMCSSLVVNNTGPGRQWIIPAITMATDALSNMLVGTAGTMNSTPTPNTTYYIASDPTYFQYTITATSNIPSMGSVTGGGTYNYGDTISLTATPNKGYHFVNWSNGETTPTIRVVVKNDTTLTANFAINKYTITALTNNPAFGNVTGGGTYYYGAIVTLTATPNSGCHFVNWSNGETTPSITFAADCDTVLCANFVIDKEYSVTAIYDSSMGIVTGEGFYEYGQVVTLTAEANKCCKFVKWSNGETTPTISFTIDRDTSLTAFFDSCVVDTIETDAIIVGAQPFCLMTYSSDGVLILDTCLSSTGDHYITCKGTDGCDSLLFIVRLTEIGFYDDVENISDVKIDIVPNPVNAGATAFIHGDFGEVDRVEIVNGFGQMVGSFVPDTYPIEIGGIEASGIYYVRLIAKDGNVHVRKMIVR